MNIGDKIRQTRKSKGLTQKQLADRLGVSYVMIGHYENGKRNPKIETLEKIAEALETPFTDLLENSNFMPLWYSVEALTSDTMHNSSVELIEKVKDKYPNDIDVIKLISNLSGYMTHINNLGLNATLDSSNADIKKIQADILGDYYHLNDDGKKLVDDYIQMIHDNKQFRNPDTEVHHDDEKGVFYFYFKEPVEEKEK